MIDISQAARSSVPFTALDVKVAGVVRHPDTRAAEITVVINGTGLNWQANDDGRSTAKLTVAAVSLTENKDPLSSRIENVTLSRPTQDRTAAGETAKVALTIPIPRKTRSVRVVVETEKSGKIGEPIWIERRSMRRLKRQRQTSSCCNGRRARRLRLQQNIKPVDPVNSVRIGEFCEIRNFGTSESTPN